MVLINTGIFLLCALGAVIQSFTAPALALAYLGFAIGYLGLALVR